MKKIVLLLTLIVTLVSFDTGNDIEQISANLSSGNARALAGNFDNTIDISFPEKSGSYSRNQAEMIMVDFFKLHPVKKFEILHKSENTGSSFFIGNLITKNGTYRTTIYLKFSGSCQKLQEIRFDLN